MYWILRGTKQWRWRPPHRQAEAHKALNQERYVPRPRWQIAAAWIGLAIVIAGVILYYYNIATGGM